MSASHAEVDVRQKEYGTAFICSPGGCAVFYLATEMHLSADAASLRKPLLARKLTDEAERAQKAADVRAEIMAIPEGIYS
jgi:hypothetical protein